MTKRFALLFCLLIFPAFVAFSQDSTWFKDVTFEVGLDSLKTSHIQSADVNGDNYPDLLVGTGGLIPGYSNTFSLYLNVPDPERPGKRKFVDFTEESGINKNRYPELGDRHYDVAILGDVDNDGDLDLVSSIYYHRLEWVREDFSDRTEVYLNDGSGRFTLKKDAGLNDFQFAPNLPPGLVDAVGLSFLDYDYDGVLDLYIATKFIDYKRSVYFPDFLFKGVGDGSFVEAKNSGVQAQAEPLYGVNVTDYNNDGWQDVITSAYCRTGGRILENLKNGTFVDVGPAVGYSSHNYGGDWYMDPNTRIWRQQPLCQWEAPPADFDNDGDMDLLQCLIHGGFEERNGKREGHTHIAVNQGPPDYKFLDDLDIIHRNESAKSHLGDYSGLWIDFQNDGWQDLVICQGHYWPTTDRAYFCLQRDDRQFYDVTDKLGLLYIKDAASVQLTDYDLDGDNDVLIFHNKPFPQLRLLENEIGSKNDWISVKLIAPSNCNKDAIGARVTVYADSIAQIREIQTGLGHFGGQHPFILNFGLGKLGGVDSIKIRWPKLGVPVTSIYNPPIDLIVVIDSAKIEGYIKTWNAAKGIAKFDRTRLVFDTTDVGNFRLDSFKIVNVGDSDLRVSKVYLAGEDSSAFSLLGFDNEPFVLKPNESRAFAVKFAPPRRKLFSANVLFQTDAANKNLKRFVVRGYGYEPKPLIVCSPDSVFFDSVKTSAVKSFVIRDVGELPLKISSIKIKNDSAEVFSLADAPSFPLVVSPNDSLSAPVRFSPKRREKYSASLEIRSDAYENETKTIPLIGLGDAPTPMARFLGILLNFSSVEIGKSKSKQIKIENYGDGVLNIDSVKIADNEDGAYKIGSIDSSIAPGQTGIILVSFEPRKAETYYRNLRVYSDAFNAPEQKIFLRGRGKESSYVENAAGEELRVAAAPNPAASSVKITLRLSDPRPREASLSLFDSRGVLVKKIFSGKIADGFSLDLDVSDLADGFYAIKVALGEKSLTKTIAIKK